MGQYITYFQKGGVAEAASYMIPIYGTYKSIKDAVRNPTLGNIGMAGLSLAGDVGSLFGVGAIAKGAVAASKTAKMASAATKGYEAARATTTAAKATASASAKAANRATGKVNSLTLMGAPTNKIMDAEKAAQAARTTAKSDYNAYRRARIAEEGVDPRVVNKVVSARTGVTTVPTTQLKSVGNPMSLYSTSSAKGAAESAQVKARLADQTYRQVKRDIPFYLLGNAGGHASGLSFNVLA